MTQPDQHYRPLIHFSPPANWINDPNGLVYYQGEYHLFYQYHPGSSVWGPMHWGHAVSPDLVNWQHLPIALYPDEHGTIFSGSAVIDWDGTAGFGREAMVAFFTHHHPTTHRECQSLAYSTDRGRTWTKYAGNPVLPPPEGLRDFRDPKVIWYGERGTGHWVMALAAGDAIRFYTSFDLIHWQPGGIFGAEHGSHEGVWETPDLFELPVENSSETRWVLTVGVGAGGPGAKAGMQYFIGHFDGQTFTSHNPKETVLWADYGADYYAAQSWSDVPGERRLMVGWQNNWQYANQIPTTTWRGVFSLPREVSLQQTGQGIRLFQRPAPEVFAQRGAHARWQQATLTPGVNLLEEVHGDAFEMIAEFVVQGQATCFGLRVRVGDGEQTTVGYDPHQQQIFVDRTRSGECGFEPGFARVHSAPLAPVEGVVKIHLFLDRTCLDVFGNDGQVTIADTIFPSQASQGVAVFSEGGAVVLKSLDLYALQPAGFTVVAE